MAEKIKIGGELEPKTVEGILGDSSTIVDRTNYDTPKRQDEVNAEKINFSDIKDAASASAVDWEDEDKPVSARTAKVIKEYVENKLPDDVLLDNVPTADSNNAVKSGGTKQAIDNVAFSTSEKVNEVGIDSEPTAGSNNLVKSGGVQNELALGAVYDVSAKNPTAGSNNDGKWESLSALLSDANLNTIIPTAYRKGGMSIKFVCSSDNKYVQYKLKTTFFSITVTDWQEDLNIVDGGWNSRGELSFVDEDDNCIGQFKNGHIKTKNFDSSLSVTKSYVDTEIGNVEESIEIVDSKVDILRNNSALVDGGPDTNSELSFVDENDNCIARFKDGHLKTKHFDSVNTVSKAYVAEIDNIDDNVASFSIIDENRNGIVQFKEGHIQTQKFDSRDCNLKFAGIDLRDASLGGSAYFQDGVAILPSGSANYVEFDADIMAWYYKMIAVWKCTSATPSIVIKKDGYYGTSFEITGSTLSIYKTGEFVESKDIGFSLVQERIYTITIEHIASTEKRDTFEIFDNYGNYYSYTGNYVFHSYGNPKMFSDTSDCIVYRFDMTMQKRYSLTKTKMMVTGHSYVEADSLGANRLSCFANLLDTYNGEGSVVNCGLGGDSIRNMNIKLPFFLKMNPNVQYVLMCIGGNDASLTLDELKEQIQLSISIVELHRKTPILFTIEPDKTGYRNVNFPTFNEWVRTSGYLYVDLDKVFYLPDGTINQSLYLLDGQHPTIEGHLHIFRRIITDCPFLF